jgi:hypothetical protein
MSKALTNDRVICVSRTLAVELGLEEAVVLQQIFYWQKKMGRKVFNSYTDWLEQFPWMNLTKIRRTIKSLEGKSIILSTIDKVGGNKKCYELNPEHPLCSKLIDPLFKTDDASVQNGQTSVQIEQDFQATQSTQRIHNDNTEQEQPARRLVINKSSASWKDYSAWIAWWNKQRGQRRSPNDNDFKNFMYWNDPERYDLLDMKAAIIFMRYDSYWGDQNVAPGVMLRQFLKDKSTPCDHIGDFLSIRQPGNPDVEGLRSDYMKLRNWFDNGQPLDQLTDVLMTLKHFGYDQLVTELAQKAKEAQHVGE